jgi:hypothetical protein
MFAHLGLGKQAIQEVGRTAAGVSDHRLVAPVLQVLDEQAQQVYTEGVGFGKEIVLLVAQQEAVDVGLDEQGNPQKLALLREINIPFQEQLTPALPACVSALSP